MCSLVRSDGFDYAFDPSKCEECGGKCCAGSSGYIFVTDEEIAKIAQFLGDTEAVVRGCYIKRVGKLQSIREREITKNNYECLFFDSKTGQCKIYAVRPTQCRTFPFWDSAKDQMDLLKEICIGVIDD